MVASRMDFRLIWLQQSSILTLYGSSYILLEARPTLILLIVIQRRQQQPQNPKPDYNPQSEMLPRRSALAAGSSNDRALPNPANPNQKQRENPKREKKEKTVSQEAWNLLKASMVKVTEADGLKGKLLTSGMFLVIVSTATRYTSPRAHSH